MAVKTSKLKAALAFFLIFVGTQTKPTAAADATGTWLTEDGRARVRTERCGPGGAQLCGYIVWASKPRDDNGQLFLDRANPDPRKKTRPLLGHQMILSLDPSEKGRFEGKIYNGDNGKSYDVTVWSERPAQLLVEGCMLAILCATQAWTRVTDVPLGQLQGATDAEGGPQSDREWAQNGGAASGSGSVQKSRSTGKPSLK